MTLHPWDCLPQVLPAQLLCGDTQVLTLEQTPGKFGSWVSVAGGWEETPADKQGLITLEKTSGAWEAEAGWMEKQEDR